MLDKEVNGLWITSGRRPFTLLIIFAILSTHQTIAATSANRSNTIPKRFSGPVSAGAARAAMSLLLNGDPGLSALFDGGIGRNAVHVPHASRSREGRQRWMRLYRKFLLHEDVDGLLKTNVSARVPTEPLLLGRDIDLWRVSPTQSERQRIASFHGSSTSGVEETSRLTHYAVDHSRVHQAFVDGFEIVVHDMHLRSRGAHDIIDPIAAFWTVPVTADLHLVPTKTSLRLKTQLPVTYAPEFHAADIFVVQLDGEQQVELFEDSIEAPLSEHIEDYANHLEIAHKVQAQKPRSFHLVEGDTLFIPRGFAYDGHTGRMVSLHLTIAIHTTHRITRDAMLAVVDALGRIDADSSNPLRERLTPVQIDSTKSDIDDLGNNATYESLLRAAILVATGVTADFRRYFPVGDAITEAIDDADGPSAAVSLEKYVLDFADAAQTALFEPLIDLLASNEAHGVTGSMDKMNEIRAWALRLRQSHRPELSDRESRMFQRCTVFMRKHAPEAVRAALPKFRKHSLSLFEKDRIERLKLAATSLALHGEPVRFVPEVEKDGIKEDSVPDRRRTSGDEIESEDFMVCHQSKSPMQVILFGDNQCEL